MQPHTPSDHSSLLHTASKDGTVPTPTFVQSSSVAPSANVCTTVTSLTKSGMKSTEAVSGKRTYSQSTASNDSISEIANVADGSAPPSYSHSEVKQGSDSGRLAESPCKRPRSSLFGPLSSRAIITSASFGAAEAPVSNTVSSKAFLPPPLSEVISDSDDPRTGAQDNIFPALMSVQSTTVPAVATQLPPPPHPMVQALPEKQVMASEVSSSAPSQDDTQASHSVKSSLFRSLSSRCFGQAAKLASISQSNQASASTTRFSKTPPASPERTRKRKKKKKYRHRHSHRRRSYSDDSSLSDRSFSSLDGDKSVEPAAPSDVCDTEDLPKSLDQQNLPLPAELLSTEEPPRPLEPHEKPKIQVSTLPRFSCFRPGDDVSDVLSQASRKGITKAFSQFSCRTVETCDSVCKNGMTLGATSDAFVQSFTSIVKGMLQPPTQRKTRWATTDQALPGANDRPTTVTGVEGHHFIMHGPPEDAVCVRAKVIHTFCAVTAP